VTNQGVTPGKIVLSACATADYLQHMAWKAKHSSPGCRKQFSQHKSSSPMTLKQFTSNAKTVHQQRQAICHQHERETAHHLHLALAHHQDQPLPAMSPMTHPALKFASVTTSGMHSLQLPVCPLVLDTWLPWVTPGQSTPNELSQALANTLSLSMSLQDILRKLGSPRCLLQLK